MFKKVLFAAVATGFVAVLALPVQVTQADAATVSCRAAAKAKFAKDFKARRAYIRACRAAWKAQHKA